MKKSITTFLAIVVLANANAQIIDSLKVGSQAINYEILAPSVYEDFSAAPFGQKLLFVSSRPIDLALRKDKNGQRYFDLLSYDIQKQEVRKFSNELSSIKKSKFHFGPATILPDSAGIIYSRNYRLPNLDDEINFYLGFEDWSTGKSGTLPFCSKAHSFQHPFYDAKTRRLYFSADLPGGQGGYDIYYAEHRKDGSWSEPLIVDGVNGPRDDVFPTVSKDGVLYFSRTVTRQGLDIFSFKNGQIKSMGAPLNTSGDDFSLVSLSNDSVVFSQSKSNGEAYSIDLVLAWVNSSEGYSRPESSTNSIVKIKLNDNSEADQILEKSAQLDERLDSVWMVERDGVQVVSIQADGLDSTRLAQLLLSGESMAVEDSKALRSEGKSRTDIGDNNDVDASYQSIVVGVYKNPAGATAGLQKVSQWAPEAFVSNINGRYYVISSVVNNDIEAKNAKNIAIENGIDGPWSIQDKLIVTSLPNIKASPDLVVYFKFDDDNLQEKYQNQISQVIDALPADVRNVFMVGHTDSRGTRSYNNKLSIRRVQGVSEFISSTHQQFGESQILNHAGEENLQNECENGVECDEYAHFLNRRVEIWFY